MLKKVFTTQTAVLFLVFFAVLAVTESAGFGPSAVAARIRAKF